jgi:indolepyruvate ferredoxin oxidoreductase alpha subunit
LRRFAESLERVLVIEEGYPFAERALRGLLPTRLEILGRDSGALPPSGELSVTDVRRALGLAPLAQRAPTELALPARPPQLCDGCGHRDAYGALLLALKSLGADAPHVVTGDIGCYTLGALPPYRAIDSCVCMGASVGMAKGAADAGLRPAVALIGDSTFLHSGIPPLIDAVAHDTDMTLLILDNGTVAMTGGQPTALPGERLTSVVLGLGADPAHVHGFEAHPRKVEQLAQLIRAEIAHPGLSVIVVSRECIVAQRARKGS